MSRAAKVGLAIAGVVAVGLVVTYVLPSSSEDTNATVHDSANGAPRLVAVDSSGAVLQSPTKTWGVTRDGAVTWVVSAKKFAPLYGVCAPRCPAAVLSSDIAAINSPLAEDPPPMTVGGGFLPESLGGSTGGKAAIVALSDDGGLRLGSNSAGDISWTVAHDDDSHDLPAPNSYVDWFPSSDGTAAIASIDVPQGRQQQLWTHTRKSGWQPTGSPTVVASGFGCVDRNARHWVTDSLHLSSRSGMTDLDLAEPLSNCGFSAGRLIVMNYQFGNGEAGSHMREYTLAGDLISESDFAGERVLVTNTRGTSFALVGGGFAEIYGPDGTSRRRITNVQDARFDNAGDLVTLTRSGQVTWQKP